MKLACAAPIAMHRATAGSILLMDRYWEIQRLSHLSVSITADISADTRTGFLLNRMRPSNSASSSRLSEPGIHMSTGGGGRAALAASTAASCGLPFLVPPCGCSAKVRESPIYLASSSNRRDTYRS